MDSDKKIEKTFEQMQAVAKKDKNIDVATLMLSVLETQHQNLVSSSARKWAYIVSAVLPPFGFLFAIKFFLDDKDDAKNVAWACVVLTIISVSLFYFLAQLLFAGDGSILQQAQQIKPADIRQLAQ